ncbi:UPF0280 family protein [Pseudoruegeria sp. HB172150]|uniref:UPF0280 family protein n=1 Tax=Pseudoruegeria sp. HB172150 TaxID=2721164 RepID=UPI00155604A1
MERASAVRLPDGRLHLQHGPIDIIAGAEGPGREAAYARAEFRFEGLLAELAAELPELRRPVTDAPRLYGPVAQAMLAATGPFAPVFVTPMAAVAGAVADEICGLLGGDGVDKAYANNGGDVAIHLTPGASTNAAIAAPVPAQVTITHADPIRGIATSGWRGRSHSLGIADSVTVLARTAAMADVAATLIANAVDLPDHSGITRTPARDLSPDSDLGDRPVTTGVPILSKEEVRAALNRGLTIAEDYRQRGLIVAAFLVLQGETTQVGPFAPALTPG